MSKENLGSSKLPGMEFEGPLGIFWDLEHVPIEALAKAFREILGEAKRRGYSEKFIINLALSTGRNQDDGE